MGKMIEEIIAISTKKVVGRVNVESTRNKWFGKEERIDL